MKGDISMRKCVTFVKNVNSRALMSYAFTLQAILLHDSYNSMISSRFSLNQDYHV